MIRNRTASLGATAALIFILAGCAATGPQQEETTAPAQAEAIAPAPAAAHKQPCEKEISDVVQQARATMHSVKKDCNGVRIVAYPMWDMNYAGTVHVTVLDAAGKVILDEYRQP